MSLVVKWEMKLIPTIVHVSDLGVASIKLEEVHPPVSEGLSVQLQVELAARVASACFRPKVLVDPEL